MERRAATIPKKIRLTPAGLDGIQTWADAHGMSFSAAVETLCGLGMGQAVEEVLASAIISVIRRELVNHHDRLIRLVLYCITEAGAAARLAGAAVKYQRQGEAGVYERIRDSARMDARRSLGRAKISAIIKELTANGDH